MLAHECLSNAECEHIGPMGLQKYHVCEIWILDNNLL